MTTGLDPLQTVAKLPFLSRTSTLYAVIGIPIPPELVGAFHSILTSVSAVAIDV